MHFPGIKTYHRASRDALFEYRQTVEMPGILAVQYRRLLELRRIEGSIYVYDEVDFPGTALAVLITGCIALMVWTAFHAAHGRMAAGKPI